MRAPSSGGQTVLGWNSPSGKLGRYIESEAEKTLRAYREQPSLVDEHANHEEDTARGGYQNRQLFELVQNGADALARRSWGKIEMVLTSTHFYCADDGIPINEDGVKSLMFSHLSPKRGTAEIGRFGLGFKSVLGVTDKPEFYSRSGSFRFDRQAARSRIHSHVPGARRYPVLRLPEPFDPGTMIIQDATLRSLTSWAVNIVRLPLKRGSHMALLDQIDAFPPEFLLFVGHVAELIMRTEDPDRRRTVSIHEDGPYHVLDDAGQASRWLLAHRLHPLSDDARSDLRSLDEATRVPIWWAAPLDRLDQPGDFWAFFPTKTSSLLAGILNAPWKTNEDRQNLLPGPYNDELIDAAAAMVADTLPELSVPEDPARHLDVLPRRKMPGDNEHSQQIRDKLNSILWDRQIVPNQSGQLQKLNDLDYQPDSLVSGAVKASEALARWETFCGRPIAWMHHSGLRPNRLAALGRLYDSAQDRFDGPHKRHPTGRSGQITFYRGMEVSRWLEALLEKAGSMGQMVESSMAAIQAASLIPQGIRKSSALGDIVLTIDGRWLPPDPDHLFFGRPYTLSVDNLVHPELEADSSTKSALEVLGIRQVSSELVFNSMVQKLVTSADRTHGNRWRELWELSRELDVSVADAVIREHRDWRTSLRVLTLAGRWTVFQHTLIPGKIVPDDGTRDSLVALDKTFHDVDLPLLEELGLSSEPADHQEMSFPYLYDYRSHCRAMYRQQGQLSNNPRKNKLNFVNPVIGPGPLEVLELLSDEGKARYTWHLLDLRGTYNPWVMKHDTQLQYPEVSFDSPAVEAIRQHGWIQTDEGCWPLDEAFGNPPRDTQVWAKLLSHPRIDQIRQVFDVASEEDSPLEPVGEDMEVALLDHWPGLMTRLVGDDRRLLLVRCDRLLGPMAECVVRDGYIYLARQNDERWELSMVLNVLDLPSSKVMIDSILSYRTPEDIEQARAAVRVAQTDVERLLVAVGEHAMRIGLPAGVVEALEGLDGPLSGLDLAEVAIANFHTGALHHYRIHLEHLRAPRQWAGRPEAVKFVRALGFDEDWAGDSQAKRPPFVEVEGPCSLPPLHDYQLRVADNVKRLIRGDVVNGGRRGMLSMPTGSGKTRVAVQSIVEMMRDDDFDGGILWIADRDELCEQAVESWRQVWASEGTQARRLRISRMWGGQRPEELQTRSMHVVVATIQTLRARLENRPEYYEFLKDFVMLIFDEAHRSVAPTFTSVMEELGLTRWRRASEPILVGLTATPYRGHDERETNRLVARYGRYRIDAGAFASEQPEDVIRELQAKRVIARADHAVIDGGTFSLSAAELRQSENIPWLPQSVEDRIAGDAERTHRIVEAYLHRIDPGWPALVFATSVRHSQTIAALLTRRGITARAVSANTPAWVRRKVVQEFKAGKIRALVNYGIFREGFDAPKTRAIVVARPVYSPNLYFQMIGRGLRGVLNGGNDRCLILDVADNIENFDRQLAFSGLDWLWDRDR